MVINAPLLTKTLLALLLSGLVLASGIAEAQRGSGISVDRPNSKTLATQRKVDDLFDAGEYERAFFIYRNELAPLGDKYAQYMVGYLYLTGQGVEEDYAAASAWYQLAAERGTREFVAVRDQLTRSLTSEQIRQSDELYEKLRMEFSDLAVLMASIRQDHSELEMKTGTRVNSEASQVTVIDARVGRTLSGNDYYGRIRKQLGERLVMLKELGDFEELETDPDKINIHELERRVQERLRFGE
jgi:Sel1 repeat